MAVDGFLFGGGVADFVVVADPDTGELTLGADTPVWFYNAATGGTRYETGLTDLSGATITEVTSDSHGAVPQLRGPTDIPYLWADASEGAGPRRLMVPADLGSYVTELRSNLANALADLADAQTLLAASLGVVRYDAGTSSWPTRPSDGRVYAWVGPSVPSGMAAGDLFFNTSPGS